jgi:hypothetical protein
MAWYRCLSQRDRATTAVSAGEKGTEGGSRRTRVRSPVYLQVAFSSTECFEPGKHANTKRKPKALSQHQEEVKETEELECSASSTEHPMLSRCSQWVSAGTRIVQRLMHVGLYEEAVTGEAAQVLVNPILVSPVYPALRISLLHKPDGI